MKVYNTLTGAKEEFTPVTPGKIGMYVCGVTVYDLCHIGHARAGIVFDVIYRYLQYRGYDVTYVRNITDIDDKIINRARETGEEWSQIAEKYTKTFTEDMNRLGLKEPDVEPKATDHIAEMHQMIAELIEKGHAYESAGSVYFAVNSFDEYGVLSKRNLDDLVAGARVDINETKKNPLDFALWKASKPGEPTWDSPWGAGRPGWHIECSAMGRKYLGNNFDIHGGGKDLVFPHHENEIAQSHASSGVRPVNHWIHNGFVTIAKEKMSKSLGNFSTIRDLLEHHNPEALRLFLLTNHYKNPIDFADTFLAEAYKTVSRFYDLLAFSKDIADGEEVGADESVKGRFIVLMDDDFNTATALAHLQAELRRLNQVRAEMSRLKKKSDQYKELRAEILAGATAIIETGETLGLFQADPDEFISLAKTKKLKEVDLSNEKLSSMIEARVNARKNKDFATSDQIRDELLDKGILLQDTAAGTDWSIKLD